MTTFKIENWQIVDGKIPDEIIRSIPAGTTKLDLTECTSLTTLPENLPAGLKILDLRGCLSFITLPENLPAGLNKLWITWCENLRTLSENLPTGLNELVISECSNLTNLPPLPAGLNELSIYNCSRLENLPDLPRGLKRLGISRCSSLTTLLPLPAGLKELNLSLCTNLTTLPDLPASIEYLDLRGCTSLSPESIPKLLALEEANQNNPYFQLHWPEHLVSNNQAITSLKESYQTYYANNPNFAGIEPSADHPTNFQTLKLFHRFTSENLGTRGKKEVIAQAILVAEEIKKNPELLEILDKTSDYYLANCVNQPVSGFLEIASLMAIAKEDNITAKIAKAKILRAQQLIKNNISSLRNLSNQTVGTGVEVELGNAMIREVHKKLLAKKVIKEPWLGIPRNISYEGSIRSFLTEENINKMTDLATEALLAENSEQEAIEFLCATKPEFWKMIIFSKEEREAFDQPYNQKIKTLQEEISELELSDEGELREKTKAIKKIEETKSAELHYQLKQRTQDLLGEYRQKSQPEDNFGSLFGRVSMREHDPLSQSRARSLSPRLSSSPRPSPTMAQDNHGVRQKRRHSIG